MAFECHNIGHRFDFFCLREVDYVMISIVKQKEKKKKEKKRKEKEKENKRKQKKTKENKRIRKRKKKRRIVQIRSNKLSKIRQHNDVEYSIIPFNVI